MRLPRAMRSAATNGGNPFRERNAERPGASAGVNKDSGATIALQPPRSPVQRNRTAEEKENFGL